MAIHVSERQLDQIEHGQQPAVIVRSERTKKGYAVIRQKVYEQFRPLLQCVAMQVEVPQPGNGHTIEWTEQKNARRVALVNKKYDQALTNAEKRELAVLAAEADRYRDRTAHVQTEILELILAGLKQQAAKKAKR